MAGPRIKLIAELDVWRLGWKLDGAAAEALAVLTLCAWLQVRRLKSKGRKHSWAIVGTFMAGIIIAGVPGAVAAYFMLKANDLVWA
jgi:hypothetical protein